MVCGVPAPQGALFHSRQLLFRHLPHLAGAWAQVNFNKAIYFGNTGGTTARFGEVKTQRSHGVSFCAHVFGVSSGPVMSIHIPASAFV